MRQRLACTVLLAVTLPLAGVTAAFATIDSESPVVFRYANGATVTVAYVNERACHAGAAEIRSRGYDPTECAQAVYGSGAWWIGAPQDSWYLVYVAA